MTKDGKVMTCIVGQTVRNIVAQANELEIPREDIINMFALGGQIYLVFYKYRLALWKKLERLIIYTYLLMKG